MDTFSKLSSDNNIKEILKITYDVDLDISGGWGYDQNTSTSIHSINTNSSIEHTEYVFASMRAYTEMNMTLKEEDRYGSINVNEKNREELTIDGKTFHKVIYEITAMKENIYKSFINEYKEKLENKDFDISDHFKRRKEATLTRSVTHWFNIT